VLASSTVKECSQSPGIATKVPGGPGMPWWPPALKVHVCMRDGSTSSTAVDYLVQKREAVICLDSCGHYPPKISDLPVGRGVFGMGDKGLRNGRHIEAGEEV
jgi:hypothetical protein